jgi:hypothetical protein
MYRWRHTITTHDTKLENGSSVPKTDCITISALIEVDSADIAVELFPRQQEDAGLQRH